MAVTENSYTGNGSTTNYSFTFPYLKSTDVQVQVDAAVTTAWQFANATTVQFNTAPANGAKIKILRDTNVDSLAATFYAGSSIKSEDLNDNYTQNLYKTQEVGARYFSNTGGTMTGDLTLAEDVELIFEGATDDAHETKLTVADPTADRTITFPDTTGTVVTTGDTGTVATGMIAADAITSAKIADDAIDNSHIAANAVGIDQIANNAVGQSELTTNSVTTAKIVDANITTAKIADNAITNAKINNGDVTEHKIGDGSVKTAKIADNQITTAKIVNDAVTADKLANTSVTAGTYSAADITVDAQGRVTAASSGTIATSEITDGAVTTAKINDDAVTTQKIAADAIVASRIADNQIQSEHYADLSIGRAHLSGDIIDGTKLADDAVNSEHYVDGSIDTAHIANNAVTNAKIVDLDITGSKIASDQIDSRHYIDGSIDTAHLGNTQVTDAKLASNAVTTSKITDANVTTDKIANDAITIGKIGCEQTTISDSDSHIPTSGAVVDYVAAQIAPLGGLEVVATEVAFPNTQPSSGVVISISDAGGVVVNGSGVSTTGRTVGGSTVTINGFPSSLQSSTLAAGIGLLVSSTGSSQTYNYHKILGKEADIKQLSDDINDFQNRYRVSGSAPTSSLDNGDLWFDTTNGKMMVYNSTNTAWEEVSAIGSFNINTLSSSGSTGGGSATFNGTAYRFTLSNPPQDAQQLLVSINGVIQKPNTGSSQPSEGFAVSGNDIIFSAAPASGSTSFIITLGQAVQIGTPSDGSVSTAKLASGAVTTAKIADDAVTAAKLSIVDNARLDLGTSNDLHLIHDGTNSYLQNITGALYINNTSGTATNLIVKANNNIELQPANGETGVKAIANGATELYYDNAKKFETKSYGVEIQGSAYTSNGDLHVADGGKLKAGNSSDLQLYHSSNESYIVNSTNQLYVRSNQGIYIQPAGNENGVVALPNGAVELYYNNGKKFSTINGGAYVTGSLGVGAATNPSHHYNQGIHVHSAGTGAVLHLTDNTSGSGASDGFDILSNAGDAYLWQRETGNMVFGTNATSRWNIIGTSGHFSPSVNNTYDIGTSSNRVRDVNCDALKFNGDTADANGLDDYEEGTFTPVSPSLTVAYSSGHYTKIGRYVIASIRVGIPSNSNANNFVLDGLPFNSRSYSGTYHNGGYLMYSGGNSYGDAAQVLVYDNSDRLQMYTKSGGNIMLTNLDNIQLRIQVHYFTD